MTMQAPAPYLGQFVDADTEVDLGGVSYYAVRLAPDGSRRILDDFLAVLNRQTWPEHRASIRERAEGDPLVLWGASAVVNLVTPLILAARNGWYLPYPPADGIPIAPVEDPPNQIPYLRAFLNHCCTFAHELLVDHQPHASRLRGIHSWNIAPDITLDVDSINKNRVGMRYYRGRLGYFYDKIEDFEALPGDTSRLSQFDLDWRAELPEMQTLDSDLCGDCRDDGGGSRLRDFIHYCNVAEWDRELDKVETLSVGVSVQYRFRLPKIDRSNPDDLRPHSTRNVRTWVSNNASAESGWRIMMRDFNAAVKRYDRDPSVRMAVQHIP